MHFYTFYMRFKRFMYVYQKSILFLQISTLPYLILDEGGSTKKEDFKRQQKYSIVPIYLG